MKMLCLTTNNGGILVHYEHYYIWVSNELNKVYYESDPLKGKGVHEWECLDTKPGVKEALIDIPEDLIDQMDKLIEEKKPSTTLGDLPEFQKLLRIV